MESVTEEDVKKMSTREVEKHIKKNTEQLEYEKYVRNLMDDHSPKARLVLDIYTVHPGDYAFLYLNQEPGIDLEEMTNLVDSFGAMSPAIKELRIVKNEDCFRASLDDYTLQLMHQQAPEIAIKPEYESGPRVRLPGSWVEREEKTED